MRWINNISDLDYYNKPSWVNCSCVYITQANDLILQGDLDSTTIEVGGSYDMVVVLLSADGQTVFAGNISSYFDIWYGVNPISRATFFNMRLKQFVPQMCTEKCFILRVTVAKGGVVYFDKYTERFCQFTCCEPAGNITMSVSGASVVAPGGSYVPSTVSTPLVGECGTKLIRIISKFPCYDNFSGEYYGIPSVVRQGTASFSFEKINTINAHVLPQPKEITRQISYNCRLQRSETKATYLLEGKELMPAWLMKEIENQLCAPMIWIDDYPVLKQYQYSGGTPFIKPEGVRTCDQYFKLNAILEDCTIRQTFGCDDTCTDASGALGYNAFFVLPDSYQDGNPIYNDSGQLIGYNVDDLINWLTFQPGITDVSLVAASPIDCSYFAVIGISGLGHLPNIIYLNNTSPGSRLYSISVDDLSEICDLIPQVQCAMPVIGEITISPVACATPVIGTVEVITVTPERVYLSEVGEWEIVMTGSPAAPENTWADILNNQVVLNLKVRNYTIFDETIEFSAIPIANLPAAARPPFAISLNSTNNGQLTDDQVITIDEYGVVTYTGQPTGFSPGTYIEIEFSNLIYNI